MILQQPRSILRNALRRRYGLDPKLSAQRQYNEQFAYGHREILLEYSELPSDLIFKAIIPHGKIMPHALDPIVPSYDILDGSEILQLLWRDDSSKEASKLGISNVTPIGAPFLYALANRKQGISTTIENLQALSNNYKWALNNQQDLLDNSRQVTYFPLHSWDGDVHTHKVPEDFLLRRIDPKRVKVCLGFLDFCDPEVRKVYTDIGWQLTCAGVRASKIVGSPAGGRQKFLYELANIIDDADFIIANEFTTGLLYAAAAGKQIGILPTNKTHDLVYSSWESSKGFHKTLQLQMEQFPWLWGKKTSPDKIMSDMGTALGISSFRGADFFQNHIQKMKLSGYGLNLIE